MTETTWLVQRLEKPCGRIDGLFTCSGPFRNNVRKALDSILTLDYMGSSEFEFGTIPKAIDALAARQSELRAKTIEVVIIATQREQENIQYHLNGARTSKEIKKLKATAKWLTQPQTVPVYILAPEGLLPYAEYFIGKESKTPFGGLKEMTFFRDSLLRHPYREKNVGWFELDNGFMFFTDKTMFENVAAVFGVKTEASPTAPNATQALRETVPATIPEASLAALVSS